MRGSFLENMFNNYPSAILRDDMLEGSVVKGCGRKKDVIGNGIDECPGHDDVTLTGFDMEYFSHKRYQKVKMDFDGSIWWKSGII